MTTIVSTINLDVRILRLAPKFAFYKMIKSSAIQQLVMTIYIYIQNTFYLPPVSGVQYAYACNVDCTGPGHIQADPTHNLIAKVIGHNIQASSHGVSAGIIDGKVVTEEHKKWPEAVDFPCPRLYTPT
jgi:hypothetical protein